MFLGLLLSFLTTESMACECEQDGGCRIIKAAQPNRSCACIPQIVNKKFKGCKGTEIDCTKYFRDNPLCKNPGTDKASCDLAKVVAAKMRDANYYLGNPSMDMQPPSCDAYKGYRIRP